MSDLSCDPSDAPWLFIADELVALHEFIYGAGGLFAHLENMPFRPTCVEASDAIRARCTGGRWHALSEAWFGATANDPLRTLMHEMGGDGHPVDLGATGREAIERIRWLRVQIDAADSRWR